MRIFKALCCSALLFASVPAFADSDPGYVSKITTLNNGAVTFDQYGTRYSISPCHTASGARWAFDGSTPAGQAKLASLLSAYSLHKKISIIGANQCPDAPGVETFWNFTITDVP